MGYLIEAPKEEQIVTAKVTLTSANLLTPGYIVDIPEYPAVKDYYWQVLKFNAKIVNGSTPYVGTSQIHIQNASAPNYQSRFINILMQQSTGVFTTADFNTTINATIYTDNDNLQIHNPGTLTLGDTDLNLYITAILIPL
jgi:hypothetical protein